MRGNENDRQGEREMGSSKNSDEEFRYDIIEETDAHSDQKLPTFFFSDDLKEAEEVYKRFKSLLNAVSTSYSISTGLSKSDLFGEALFGLAKAKRDFDRNKGKGFKSFATAAIKNSLNEFVRKFSSQTSVPSYLKKSSNHLSLIKESLNLKHASLDSINFELERGEASEETKDNVKRLLVLLANSAERAGVRLSDYVERVELLPSFGIDSERVASSHDELERKVQASITVSKMKENMTEEERKISEMIMSDMSYREIGESFGRSQTWVLDKVNEMRRKFSHLRTSV
jgi:RNA polymerase sigma factor (sigma-70 family)